MDDFKVIRCGQYSSVVYVNPQCKNTSYQMSIVDPRSFEDGGIEWRLRYTKIDETKKDKLVAASIISSYDYLLSDAMTTKEAINRLRILRKARALLTTTEDKS